MFATANPTLSDSKLAGLNNLIDAASAPKTMSVTGTAHKLGVFLLLCIFTASLTWGQFNSAVTEAAAAMESAEVTPAAVQAGWQAIMPLAIGGAIGGLVLALITFFKPQWAMVTGSLYALAEGLFLGGITAFMETMYPGIAIQAVGLTLGIAAAMVLLYSTRILRATPAFTRGIIAATVGIMLFYAASLLLNLFGVNIPLLWELRTGSTWLGIGFSLFVVAIAALNLILDFDRIETGAKAGAPKWAEWYCAFGLMVTLVWLYIEVLRLLAKLKGRE
ncbi:MAG: Bax inhibitor-1/YccA family membrane protein [Planctomycetota bacterium]